jgi:hypothetical protein
MIVIKDTDLKRAMKNSLNALANVMWAYDFYWVVDGKLNKKPHYNLRIKGHRPGSKNDLVFEKHKLVWLSMNKDSLSRSIVEKIELPVGFETGKKRIIVYCKSADLRVLPLDHDTYQRYIHPNRRGFYCLGDKPRISSRYTIFQEYEFIQKLIPVPFLKLIAYVMWFSNFYWVTEKRNGEFLRRRYQDDSSLWPGSDIVGFSLNYNTLRVDIPGQEIQRYSIRHVELPDDFMKLGVYVRKNVEDDRLSGPNFRR